MYKPSFILRPLLQVVLIGWLGMAQPAEAQQTVILSGRVTDSAGQRRLTARFVYLLFRLPGFVFIWIGRADGRTRMVPIASRFYQGPISLQFGRSTARSLPSG